MRHALISCRPAEEVSDFFEMERRTPRIVVIQVADVRFGYVCLSQMAEERLQKIIAAAGIASRRKAEELIAAGAVTVNGKVITELGVKADPERDHIKVRGRLINPKLKTQEKVYILLNKPLGVLTSRSDPKNRPLVIDLLGPYRNKVHPVGRLDFNTEGLLLLTNDGEFTNLITGLKQAPKVYEVKVKGQPSEHQIKMIERGVVIDGRDRMRGSENSAFSQRSGEYT